MKAVQSFTVRPRLPEELAALARLAHNLRWTWHRQTRHLFSWADPDGWEVGHDPVRLLGGLAPSRLEELAADPSFLAALAAAEHDLATYLNEPRWSQQRGEGPLRAIAYFSPEFGISEALPQYSGGLGVLAGDHLKAASDLGLPIVGIGLFYRHGYFRQALSVDGWQQERYPDLDPHSLALRLCDQTVTVDLAGQPCAARIWRADVGRVPLYLLDTDVDGNPPELRGITDRLYGGDVEHRLRQEIILGIGGVRALQAVGQPAQLFHTNEGHAGFLGLERVRQLILGEGLRFAEAVEVARAGSLFTTHTPVPAGIDRFPLELIEKYFSGWARECGLGIGELVALGHRPGDASDERFNMAVMGLRLAARSNGVSALHGEVSRDMFADLWPGAPEPEVPITSITNGVHGETWVSDEIDELLTKWVGPAWDSAGPEDWGNIEGIPASEIWAARRKGTERLTDFVRERLRRSELQRGMSPSDAAWTAGALDPDILTVCFSRRFATYKRATLLLSQPERLRNLLLDAERPVQFVFAGKAHPADEGGKELIRQIVQFSHDLGIRHRFAFIDDYDMSVARPLYQGADVWLNTPRRPLEACGTSGEKAALNGALNCSILDGWWAEMFTGDNGWAITSAEQVEDMERRDWLEAESLFGLFEQQIVPLFYGRDSAGVAHGWVGRMKTAWRTLGPQVVAARMVRDYTEQLYEPLAARAEHLWGDANRVARDLVAWKERIIADWADVRVLAVSDSLEVSELGDAQGVTAVVGLGRLGPEDLEVQLLHGTVGEAGELVGPTVTTMEHVEATAGEHRYAATFSPTRAGRYGYTVRIVPAHPDLVTPVELGRLAWAR
ncbi:MAG: alpha-glucan family phosphorylase [Acidimicrobiia bacterium]|nr:alpha-glucan family phosphorylase [Acidimicrobiia bacterium]